MARSARRDRPRSASRVTALEMRWFHDGDGKQEVRHRLPPRLRAPPDRRAPRRPRLARRALDGRLRRHRGGRPTAARAAHAREDAVGRRVLLRGSGDGGASPLGDADFIDPNGDSHEYYEFEINALGTGWDLLLPRPYKDGGRAVHDWEIPGLKSAVHLDGTLNDPADMDRGWTVELAFPWPALAELARRPAPPRDGDQWRVDFSRVEWSLRVASTHYEKVPSVPGLRRPPSSRRNHAALEHPAGRPRLAGLS